MRYGILGDIHGNLEALEAAIAALEAVGVDAWLQVGDVVGYGSDPVACIQILRDLDAVVVAGNHDEAVMGRFDVRCFNPAARAAVEWTRANIGPSEHEFLESLPMVSTVDDEVTLVHSSPYQPHLFEYIMSHHEADHALAEAATRLCFIGHSHVPLAFLCGDRVVETHEQDLVLNGYSRALINVGSVGQPRDENPDTACGLYDDEAGRYQLLRRPYDIESTGRKIIDAGLPQILADRLFLGL